MTETPKIDAELNVGTEVYYDGDMANMPGVGRIIRIDRSERFSDHVVVELDAEEHEMGEEYGLERREFVVTETAFARGPGQRFYIKAEWEAEQVAKIEEFKRRYAAA